MIEERRSKVTPQSLPHLPYGKEGMQKFPCAIWRDSRWISKEVVRVAVKRPYGRGP